MFPRSGSCGNMECTTNCLSKQHGSYLTSAFTIEDIETLKSIVKERCSNPSRNSDVLGRTILHICASVGRYDVLSWLCDEWKVSNILQTKDKESGWTPLHRALYYGYIDCAILIYNFLRDWHALDFEGHSPLDLLVLDSPRTKKVRKKKLRIARVVLPFESGEAGELTLHSGDVIEIVNTNQTGWGVGQLQATGAKGLFPINFVEEIKEDKVIEPSKRFTPCNGVYTWGNNVNFALGLGDSKNRTNPELIEHLLCEKKNVTHCVVTKFHSVFLTECGNIYTCGHGLDGRLGHENEETVLLPKKVEYFENKHCIAIAAAHSHTVVLDELGQVHTFGVNDFHQLGHHPPPSSCLCPKQINHKCLKNKTIIGVAAGRFHTVIHTNHEIYAFGLNAGQLGHAKGEQLVTSPKLVSHLYNKDAAVTKVVASDGATVCLLANGDIYLFQDYLCRKIALRMTDVACICVTGGVLQFSGLETFNKPEPLRIAVLHNSGVVDVWKSGFNSFKTCYWLGRKLSHCKITHISLGRHLVLTTDSSQVFSGYFLQKSDDVTKNVPSDARAGNTHLNLTAHKVEVQSGSFTLTEVIDRYKKERKQCEEVNLVRIPLLYRGVKCFTDSKSRMFAAVQSDARVGLQKYPTVQASRMTQDLKQMLTTTISNDHIHDAVIKVKCGNIPVHKFILYCRLNNSSDLPAHEINPENEKAIFDFSSCSRKDVNMWLEKVYTGENTTTVPINIDNKENVQNCDDILFANTMSSLALVDFESPFDENILGNGMAKKRKKGKKKSAYAVHQEKKNVFAIQGTVKEKTRACKDIVPLQTFHNWKNYEEVSDVTIESVDGCLIHCHKCILMARAEYFHNMLNNEWIESSICKEGTLKMPLPGNVLQVVIHYLYTDEATILKETEDISFVGEVLVCADQLLLGRLKDICELELADKVSLKNALEILQFACNYGVNQLKTFTCEFVSLNLPYYLEARLLESLPEECLHVFTKEYRSMVVGMENRIIKPSNQHRVTDELEKSLQETLSHDLHKIKSRRGRLSSSKLSKSISSMSESDSICQLSQSLYAEQLPNDVFDCSSHSDGALAHSDGALAEGKQSNNSSVNGGEEPCHSAGYVNGVSEERNGPVNGDREDTQENKSKNDNNHMAWNVNRQQKHSTVSLSEDIDFSSTNADIIPKKAMPVTPFKKKSQKDRKRERVKSLTTEQGNEEDAVEEKVEKKSVSPWGNPVTSTPSKSFREVLTEEGSPMMNDEKPQCKVKMASFSQQAKAKKLSFGNCMQEISTPVEQADTKKIQADTKKNPWKSPANDEKLCAKQSHAFTNIVHVQQEEKRELIQRAKKPLASIQLEELAIEELRKHYQSKAAGGEHITVARIKSATATPFWEVTLK